jgi:mannose-6-phosphate isomerase-like protein (cupin superfamily)
MLEPVDMEKLRLGPTAQLFQGAGEGSGVSMFIVRTPPGKFVELHVHPYVETFLLLEGHGRWTAGDETAELRDEGMIVVPPHTPHGFRNVGDVPLLVVSVHEAPQIEQTFLSEEPK